MSATIEAMGDQIAEMKLYEVVLLSSYLEEKYNLAGSSGGAAVIDTVAPPPPVDVVQTEFTVMLDGFDPAKKITVIKVVREITGCGLAEGKTLVESAPKPIKENLPKEEAEALKKKLEDAGGKVSLK